MRILHVISSLGVGGAETMLAKVLGQTAKEHEARVISLTQDGPIGERIRALGVATVSLGMRRGVPDPRGVIAVVREIRNYRPDIVQTWMYHADLIGGIAALAAGRRPVIWGLRNSELEVATSKWTTRRTLQLCALLSRWVPVRIVSCSHRARDFHIAQGYDAARMVVISNGFDLSSFAPMPDARDEVRRELGIASDAIVIGMVARYHPMKDFRTFARAANLIVRAQPKAEFVLCGEGLTRENSELRAWIEDAGVLDRTHLLGRRTDVARVMSALDLFTLSSLSEGFPNALGEAMACAVPCVTTDVGDCAFILGDAGCVVPAQDPDALAEGWNQILELPLERRADLARRGRERIASNFSIETVASEYAKVYRGVLRP